MNWQTRNQQNVTELSGWHEWERVQIYSTGLLPPSPDHSRDAFTLSVSHSEFLSLPELPAELFLPPLCPLCLKIKLFSESNTHDRWKETEGSERKRMQLPLHLCWLLCWLWCWRDDRMFPQHLKYEIPSSVPCILAIKVSHTNNYSKISEYEWFWTQIIT